MVGFACWLICCLFVFFKQKTAYEMRMSDWSSDVCSSDLYDFKARPELVGTALEDFVPHRDCAGTDEFFALLRHINRPDGPFETTDSGLSQSLYLSSNSPFPHKDGWVGGRVMLM